MPDIFSELYLFFYYDPDMALDARKNVKTMEKSIRECISLNRDAIFIPNTVVCNLVFL